MPFSVKPSNFLLCRATFCPCNSTFRLCNVTLALCNVIFRGANWPPAYAGGSDSCAERFMVCANRPTAFAGGSDRCAERLIARATRITLLPNKFLKPIRESKSMEAKLQLVLERYARLVVNASGASG